MITRIDIKLATLTLNAIESAVADNADDGMRPHLGASQIGKPCNRSIWYSFRWAVTTYHEPRMLRLFLRGHREEQTVVKLLEDAGMRVYTVDNKTGKQFVYATGHFGGSIDGVVFAVPDSPKTPHLLECKTANAKSFKSISTLGVQQAKPEHYAQMQAYMAWAKLTRALYIAVCKDDDQLHIERINFDSKYADRLFIKAQNIIDASEPPEKINHQPSWYQCKFCDHQLLCHDTLKPLKSCRTCAHVTPEKDAQWHCRIHKRMLSINEQKGGCAYHLFIPALLCNIGKPIDSGDTWVEYQHKDSNKTFVDGLK